MDSKREYSASRKRCFRLRCYRANDWAWLYFTARDYKLAPISNVYLLITSVLTKVRVPAVSITLPPENCTLECTPIRTAGKMG